MSEEKYLVFIEELTSFNKNGKVDIYSSNIKNVIKIFEIEEINNKQDTIINNLFEIIKQKNIKKQVIQQNSIDNFEKFLKKSLTNEKVDSESNLLKEKQKNLNEIINEFEKKKEGIKKDDLIIYFNEVDLILGNKLNYVTIKNINLSLQKINTYITMFVFTIRNNQTLTFDKQYTIDEINYQTIIKKINETFTVDNIQNLPNINDNVKTYVSYDKNMEGSETSNINKLFNSIEFSDNDNDCNFLLKIINNSEIQTSIYQFNISTECVSKQTPSKSPMNAWTSPRLSSNKPLSSKVKTIKKIVPNQRPNSARNSTQKLIKPVRRNSLT
jgi:hypothetical protein